MTEAIIRSYANEHGIEREPNGLLLLRDRREVWRPGYPALSLARKKQRWQLLTYLCQHHKRPVPTKEIAQKVIARGRRYDNTDIDNAYKLARRLDRTMQLIGLTVHTQNGGYVLARRPN